jgi:nucleotide-binding universal stress UspA family protein
MWWQARSPGGRRFLRRDVEEKLKRTPASSFDEEIAKTAGSLTQNDFSVASSNMAMVSLHNSGNCSDGQSATTFAKRGKEVDMSKTHEISAGAVAQALPGKQRLFNNILLATDFSPASDQALEYAVSLARHYSSAIYLTHVITLDGYPMVSPEIAASSVRKRHAEAENKFHELLKSGRLVALAYKVVVQEGDLWPAIEELIEKYHLDLLVVGTHGAGAVRKILIGSGAEAIFRKAKVPVLTVGPSTGNEPMYELEFKNILFATDFGRSAEREAEYAFSLAQEHCSRLRLVHVFPHSEAHGKELLTVEKESAVAQLRELVPRKTELHCKLDFEAALGEPVAQILRIAAETQTNLIVMGAKKRETLAGNVPHTKAYRVVCGAHCPVLTVRS